MVGLVYNNKVWKMTNEYGYKNSNAEVTYNDIEIDFTDGTLADIPYKYQEIKLLEADTEQGILTGNVIFTGFLDTIELSSLKSKNDVDRTLRLTLLSPLKLATVRTCTLIGLHKVSDALEEVLAPLIADGYTIEEMNITDGQITTNFVLETIENAMNIICSKRNLFWRIDEKKQIFINDLSYLFGLPSVLTINEDEINKGLSKLQPSIENIDYANVINFKNVRLIYQGDDVFTLQSITEPILDLKDGYKIMNKGDIITFNNPIIIDEDYLRDYISELPSDTTLTEVVCMWLRVYQNGHSNSYKIGISLDETSPDYNEFVSSGNFTYSDKSGTEGEVVLQRDNFYKNMITGIKWNMDTQGLIREVKSDTALRYTTMKFSFTPEIEKLKGKISDTGIIERTIDYNEKWTTLSQLVDYARSLMTQNTNIVNQIELEYDVNPNANVGDIITVNAPHFFMNGKFAIKTITYENSKNYESWKIVAKATDFVSTYIDLFRPPQKEESSKTIDTMVISEFIEEVIYETHRTEVDV